MTDIFQLHAEGIQQVQDYIGDACPSFAWNGGTWLIMPDSVTRSKGLNQGGYTLDADLVFTALMAQFNGSPPTIKNVITYDGARYRIDSIVSSPGAYQSEFHCNDVAAGV